MAIDDDDLPAAIAGHLARRLLQQLELQPATVGDGSGFVLRLEDLAVVLLGEHHRVFLLGGVERGIPCGRISRRFGTA